MEITEKILNAGLVKVRIDVNGDVDFYINKANNTFAVESKFISWQHVFTMTQCDLLSLAELSERVSFENNLEEYQKVAERKEGGSV